MQREKWFRIVMALFTVVAMFLAPELALRLLHGKLFAVESLLSPNTARTAEPWADYDPQLGWIEGVVEESGLRSNGSGTASDSSRLAGAPILALGDSFTLGAEVPNHETWPAQLEMLMGRPVLNAGVSGYGVDQAFLRAQILMPRYSPEVVLLAFISNDIDRTEASYYYGWKPYFEWVDGELVVRNVPVPREVPPYATLRAVLGYSLLANEVLRRVAPGWWYYGNRSNQRTNADGEAITAELLRRLDQLTRDQGARLVAITLGTNGKIGGDARLPAVVAEARRHGIDVLDLAPDVARLIASGRKDMFRERGHYSKSMNGWVARRIAEHIGQPFLIQ